jgi:hypothetical protein
MATKNNPGTFDCYEKAEPDEPMFVLLGRDPCAYPALLEWIAIRMELGQSTTDPQIVEARKCARAMAEWAESKGKSVDMAQRSWARGRPQLKPCDKCGKY